MTEVFDLEEGVVVATYFLKPEEAVVAAWHQYGAPFPAVDGFRPQGFCTWNYSQHPELQKGFGSVTIADRFTAFI